MIEKRKKEAEEHSNLSDAMEAFLMACSDSDVDSSGSISKEELTSVLKKVLRVQV